MIRGTKRNNTKPIVLNTSIHNRFDVEVIDAATGKVKSKAVAHNTICNNLWSRMLAGSSYFTYIHYGTGSGTPSSADTSLFAYYGGASAIARSSWVDEDTGVSCLQKYIQLAPETAVGATITEVGIAYGSSASNLCTHAMLKDMNGNLVSITKTDTDIINIYASVYCHFDPEGYMNGSVFVGGNSRSAHFLETLAGTWNGSSYHPTYAFGSRAWGMYSEQMSPYEDGVGITRTYDVTNRTLTYTMGRMGVNINNLVSGGMTGIMFASNRSSSSANYPSMYGPCFFLLAGVEGGWFPPYQITGEAVATGDGTTTVFTTKFPFASEAKVYIDGVEQTEGVTVTPGINACSHPNNYVHAIKASSRPGKVLPSTNDIGAYRRFSSWQDADGMYVYTDRWYYFYNSLYEEVPVTQIYAPYAYVEASTDMMNWERVLTFTDTSTKAVPAAYQKYPFWREKRTQSYDPSWGTNNHYGEFTMAATGGNIHFDNPPAEGSVITIDYKTKVIPKDTNHVMDVAITVRFNEYNEG